MDEVKVIRDTTGHTLTVWLGDPASEHVCEETTDEVVLMKDAQGHLVGFELLRLGCLATPHSSPQLLEPTEGISFRDSFGKM